MSSARAWSSILTESFRDEVECMQLAELRNTVAKNGLCKAGNHEDLKRKLLDHMLSKIGGSERKDQDAGEEAEKSEAAACPKAEKLDADGEQKRTQGSQKEQSEKKNSKEKEKADDPKNTTTKRRHLCKFFVPCPVWYIPCSTVPWFSTITVWWCISRVSCNLELHYTRQYCNAIVEV